MAITIAMAIAIFLLSYYIFDSKAHWH